MTAAVALAAARGALAAGTFIEDIQISKRGDEATIHIDLACPMRFQSDVNNPAGALVEIRVAPLDSCRELGVGEGVTSESYRPESGRLARLTELEYESLGLGDNLLILHFDRPVDYRVAQRGDLRTLELRVKVGADVEPKAAPPPPAPSRSVAPQPAPPPAAPVAPPTDRTPLTSRVRPPAASPDYVINLQSTRDPVDPGVAAIIPIKTGQHVYVSTTTIDGTKWYRLRLGFFASEADASAVLAGIAAKFPRAWIGRAEAPEVSAAGDLAVERGGVITEAPPAAPDAAPAQGAANVALSPQRIDELRNEARGALIAGNFSVAIRDYTALLQAPGDHRAEARENLGVAWEKNGETAHAIAEYRRYLEEFPSTDGAKRVEQRLSGLMVAVSHEHLRSEEARARPSNVTTNLTQYYYGNVDRFDPTQQELTTFSALLTSLDLTVRHRGDSLNQMARVSVSQLHDLLGVQNGGIPDQQRVSYAYYDIADAQDDWSVRVGRQSLHDLGVFGRFDGVHGMYQWADSRRVHVMTGYPVETTRDGVKTYRQFVGAAVDFDRVVGNWGFSPYVQSQTIDHMADREAVGFETRYFDQTRSLTTMIDYDTLYGELNTALLFGTWRLKNRMTLTATFDQREGPLLSTRNALIGQSASTIDELAQVWTQDEIRQLARDRTAPTRTMSFGMVMPLAERLEINADVTTVNVTGTVASGGVSAVPGTGDETYYSGTLVASALFGRNDVNIFNLRYGDGLDFTDAQLTWDTRVPVGKRLRLNPRLRLDSWQGKVTGIQRDTLRPSLRLLWNSPRRFRLEMEIGTESVKRSSATAQQHSTDKFLNAGYNASF